MVGPTASGKSAVALEIAESVGAEIVSADSMQVYRGMDIGTAKPSAADRERVVHHLVDVADPDTPFTVAEFQELGRAVLGDVAARNVPALIVGGSGLHFRSLVDPLEFPPSDPSVRASVEALKQADAVAALLEADPAAGDVVDLSNPRRVARALEVHRITGRTPTERLAGSRAAAVREFRSVMPIVVVGVDPGETLPGRVEARFDAMLEAGLLEEVTRLAPRLGVTASAAVGYRQLLPVVRGEWNIGRGRARAIHATRALARRQRTFFRRDPRVRWLEWDDESGSMAARAGAALEEAGWTS